MTTPRSKRILAFDFDGVLCNSIHDSLMTAVNVYLRFTENHSLPLSQPLASNEIFRFEEDEPRFFQQFSGLMPLCNRAQDYYVMLNIIDKNNVEKVRDQASFDAVKNTIPKEKLEAYQECFFVYRQEMQQHPESWSALLPPFPGIVDAVWHLSRRFIPAIATVKDTASVNILLEKYGLRDVFERELILDKDFGTTKSDHLKHLHKTRNVPLRNILFIDDKVSHLQEVKSLGVQIYLAVWGFNTERERKIAENEGIALLTLKDLPRISFPHPR